MLTPLLIAAIIFLVVLAILVKLKRASCEGGTAEVGLYELRTSILTPAERSFLGVLEDTMPNGIGALAKVRLADVFKTRKRLSPADRTRANNRINQKHVDFLLVRTTDLVPVAGIELDDSSHERDDRKQRDAFVDHVFRSCNLPLLHIPARATYNPAELRDQIVALLGNSI